MSLPDPAADLRDFLAGKVAGGLALVVALYRKRDTIQVDNINLLKG